MRTKLLLGSGLNNFVTAAYGRFFYWVKTMSAATDAFENKILSLYLENADAANIGDATGLRGSTTAGSLYISLHTASPGETGNQTTSEAAYTSYARQAVARSTAGWTVASGTGDNDAAITFPEATGGSETETHFGIGSAVSGTGSLDIYGALSLTPTVSAGTTPEFAAGALDISLA